MYSTTGAYEVGGERQDGMNDRGANHRVLVRTFYIAIVQHSLTVSAAAAAAATTTTTATAGVVLLRLCRAVRLIVKTSLTIGLGLVGDELQKGIDKGGHVGDKGGVVGSLAGITVFTKAHIKENVRLFRLELTGLVHGLQRLRQTTVVIIASKVGLDRQGLARTEQDGVSGGDLKGRGI